LDRLFPAIGGFGLAKIERNDKEMIIPQNREPKIDKARELWGNFRLE
jgi:hypothetical protein